MIQQHSQRENLRRKPRKHRKWPPLAHCALVRAYISKCEETTTYDRQKMKYSCGCPERIELNEEHIKEARETNKKKLDISGTQRRLPQVRSPVKPFTTMHIMNWIMIPATKTLQ